MLIDSHCHLQDRKYERDMEQVIARAFDTGVTAMVTIGYDMASSRRAIEIADAHENVFATIGVHPHDAKELGPRDVDELAKLASSPKVVAIGEIGLDFFRNLSPQDDQYRAFREQLAVAKSAKLPVVIHSRDADQEVFDVLAEYAEGARVVLPEDRPIGVMHCYAGDLPLAMRYIKIGFVLSIAGPVTYAKSHANRAVAGAIPLSSMTVETDAPYLPPQRIRGERNEPANVRDVAEYVAQLRGTPYEEVAEATAKTAARLFGLQL
jgi:TatD DNase family protein